MKNINCKKTLNKFWLLTLLASGTLFNYSILASIDRTTAQAGDLEFDVNSYTTIPNGPTTANQIATFRENTVNAPVSGGTFVQYPATITTATPQIKMTASLSNQTYTNGLTFGGNGNNAARGTSGAAVFNKMGFIASPTNGLFTATNVAGTGISTVDNYAFELFASVDPLFDAGISTNNPLVSNRYEYATLTLTFSRPVSDPVIQMTGMGGVYTNAGVNHGHTAEFELQETGITASRLSGINLNVTNNKILNSATSFNSFCDAAAATAQGFSGPGAACGSVKFAGTNITTLTFKVFVKGDNGGGVWSASNRTNGDVFLFGGASIALPVTVSGKVFDDANGLTDSLVNGSTGTNAGGLSANLVDANNKVVATSLVAADGTYSFFAIGAGAYTVSLSTVPGVQGTTAPAASLPTNWVNTGEGTAAAGDGTVDGKTAITVGTAAVPNINFGIDQLPNTTDLTPSSQVNPGGTNTVTVPTLTGVDLEDGTFSTGKSFKITALPTNGTLYYLNASNVPVAVNLNQIISNYDPTKLKLDPTNNGATTVTFTYAAFDAAGKEDPTPATVSMSFTAPVTAISITGTVWNDKDNTGSVSPFTNIQTNGESGTNAVFGTTTTVVNAILVNTLTNLVLDSQIVSSNGTYTFSNVPTGTGVQVIISPTAGTPITTPPVGAAPAGWVKTAPVAVSLTTGVTSVSGVDFGIRQKAKLVLIKRITKINTTAFTDITTDTWNPGVTNWPANYLVGKVDAGSVKPGDSIEYTIYFLNNQGADATGVKICDPIRGNHTYVTNSTYMRLGAASADTQLTDGTDRVTIYPANGAPTDCNALAVSNTAPGVAIGITGTTTPNQPARIGVSGSIGVATPTTAYGLFRFTTKVKP